MPHDTCTLTTKDFTILEVMLDRCLDPAGAMGMLLRRKLASASVTFREDVPPQVATLSSRVSFAVNDGEPDSRILSHDRMGSLIGLYLPIATLRGLALLGLSEGQAIRVDSQDGSENLILIDVLYQPEAAKREREAALRSRTPTTRRAMLRLVPGSLDGSRRLTTHGQPDDDPGPSAA